MKVRTVFGLALALSCAPLAGSGAPDEHALRVDVKEASPGRLVLDVSFALSEEKVLYAYKGHLWPVVGVIVHIEARDESGESLDIETVDRWQPGLMPHYYVRAARYRYPEPLVLNVSGLGRPFAGCLDLVVTYDTTNYHDKHLSKFRSTAEVGIVCLGPAEAELHGAGS